MRRVTYLLGTVLLAALVTLSTSIPALADARSDEVFWRINEAREARGLPPLALWPGAGQVMAANDDLAATGDAHRISDENFAHYASLGANGYAENQGWGPSGMSARRIVQAWIESPGHAANLFAPNATHLVVATTTASGNRFYTAHMLTAPSVDASDPGPQRPVGEPEPPEADDEPSDAGAGGEAGGGGDGSGAAPESTTETTPETTAEPAAEPGPGWEPDGIDRGALADVNRADMAVVEVEEDAPTPTTEPTPAEPPASESRSAQMAVSVDPIPARSALAPVLLPGALVLGAAAILAVVVVTSRLRQERLRRSIRPRSRTPRGRARRSANAADAPTTAVAAAAPTRTPMSTSDGQWTRR